MNENIEATVEIGIFPYQSEDKKKPQKTQKSYCTIDIIDSSISIFAVKMNSVSNEEHLKQ